ncbi:type IV toxin-antitoxin system AbiEi family antitoxin [Microterricola viridarii]|uniref:AbiEi antitoxin C-terminal domain-containing protein n=1 Tax=Microterricola viridarii TaxID=412690 RepID=A0A0X8E0Z9_9MICO|nr:type IV toxin-antitoxin system AbiEi family antitoxin [Microterricola viridarii]AMB58336.1 hypothetical protein AWU67_05135 [Microterricola viridarii]
MHTRTASLLLGPTELSVAELSAASLDGEVYPIAGRYCPVDLPVFPSLRAAGLLALLPEHAFVERLSAAWLHGALERQPVHTQIAVPAGVAARSHRGRTLTLRQVAVSPAELTLVGGCPVTTPERTLVDVLLDGALGDTEAVAVAAALAAATAVSPAAAHGALRSRRSVPNRALAERRLSDLTEASRR